MRRREEGRCQRRFQETVSVGNGHVKVLGALTQRFIAQLIRIAALTITSLKIGESRGFPGTMVLRHQEFPLVIG